MINVIVILMECITMWLCLHIAFGEKIKKSRWEVLFFVGYISVCVLCAYNLVSKVIYLGLWIFVFVWCYMVFRQKLISSLIRTAIGIVSVGVVETVVLFFYTLLTNKIQFSVEIDCVIACSLSMLFVIYVYYFMNSRTSSYYKNIFDKYYFIIVLIIILFLIYVKFEFEKNKTIPLAYIFFFLILTIVFVILHKKQSSLYELEKKNLNFELQSMYGEAYDILIKEVRKRQHDYKNQLMAISSMYSTASSLEDLKDMQEEYLGILQEESEYDSILTKCNNPILAGYLYNTCLKFRAEGVKIDVDVMIESSAIDIKTKDIIEVLGVLLNNAYEYYESKGILDKYISLSLRDEEGKKCVEVGNVSEHYSYDTLGIMFQKGYSSKGNNRGIGLYAVKCIVEKYDGQICVENIERQQTNWIVFKLII